MSMKIGFKFHGRCEAHPRFNPAREGLAADKAGCENCQQLYRIWAAIEHARSYAAYFTGERLRHWEREPRGLYPCAICGRGHTQPGVCAPCNARLRTEELAPHAPRLPRSVGR